MQGEGLLRVWRGGYAPSPWVSSLCFGHMLRHCSECRTCDSVSRSKQLCAHEISEDQGIKAFQQHAPIRKLASTPVQIATIALGVGGGEKAVILGFVYLCHQRCM